MKLAGLVVVASLGLAASHAREARADCGVRRWLGTPSGTAIPARGSMFLYDEWLEDRESSGRNPVPSSPGGPPAGAITARVQVAPHVLRLDYATKADELELKVGDEAHLFEVKRGWRPPEAAPRVVHYWHHASSWTCSSADSLMLQIDQPTAAVRVRWTAAGQVTPREWIVPALTAEGNVSVLELGKIDCGSTTIEPAELAAGGQLALVAIRFDGSEVPVTGLPAFLSTQQMPTTTEYLDRAIAYEPGAEPVAPVPLPPRETRDFPLVVFLGVLGILGALLYVRFGHRALKEVP